MILDREIRFWRLGVSALLTIAVVLISLGSRSKGFHDWIHGDHVACILSHDFPVSDPSGEESPEDQEHGAPDPLEAFCQTGYLLLCSYQDAVLVLPQLAESVRTGSSEYLPTRVSSSRPSRAPPVFI